MKVKVQEIEKKIKHWWEAYENDLFLVAVMVLLSMIAFGAIILWRAGFYEVEPRKIVIEEDAFSAHPKQGLGQARFVASINGKKYYPIGCKAAERIKQENRVWFSSEEEAHSMGYMPSMQC